MATAAVHKLPDNNHPAQKDKLMNKQKKSKPNNIIKNN